MSANLAKFLWWFKLLFQVPVVLIFELNKVDLILIKFGLTCVAPLIDMLSPSRRRINKQVVRCRRKGTWRIGWFFWWNLRSLSELMGLHLNWFWGVSPEHPPGWLSSEWLRKTEQASFSEPTTGPARLECLCWSTWNTTIASEWNFIQSRQSFQILFAKIMWASSVTWCVNRIFLLHKRHNFTKIYWTWKIPEHFHFRVQKTSKF